MIIVKNRDVWSERCSIYRDNSKDNTANLIWKEEWLMSLTESANVRTVWSGVLETQISVKFILIVMRYRTMSRINLWIYWLTSVLRHRPGKGLLLRRKYCVKRVTVPNEVHTVLLGRQKLLLQWTDKNTVNVYYTANSTRPMKWKT